MYPYLFELLALSNQFFESIVHWDLSLLNESMSVNKRIRIIIVNGNETANVYTSFALVAVIKFYNNIKRVASLNSNLIFTLEHNSWPHNWNLHRGLVLARKGKLDHSRRNMLDNFFFHRLFDNKLVLREVKINKKFEIGREQAVWRATAFQLDRESCDAFDQPPIYFWIQITFKTFVDHRVWVTGWRNHHFFKVLAEVNKWAFLFVHRELEIKRHFFFPYNLFSWEFLQVFKFDFNPRPVILSLLIIGILLPHFKQFKVEELHLNIVMVFFNYREKRLLSGKVFGLIRLRALMGFFQFVFFNAWAWDNQASRGVFSMNQVIHPRDIIRVSPVDIIILQRVDPSLVPVSLFFSCSSLHF